MELSSGGKSTFEAGTTKPSAAFPDGECAWGGRGRSRRKNRLLCWMSNESVGWSYHQEEKSTFETRASTVFLGGEYMGWAWVTEGEALVLMLDE